MASRHRQQTGPTIVGKGKYGGTNVNPSSRSSWQVVCDDVIGDYGRNHPFTLERFEVTGGLLNWGFPGTASYFVDCPVAFSTWDFLSVPSTASLINRIMATSGPLTPNIYLPVSIFELRDIPAMLRHAGNLLHKIKAPSGLNPVKEAGAATLAYQFGWGPLMQDIQKMCKFSAMVRKRQEQLTKANSGKGIRRKVSLGSVDYAWEGTDVVWSTYGLFVSQRWNEVRSSKQWATIRWKLRDPTKIGKTPTYGESFDAALGTSKGYIPIEVWKAMPWSWAVDWFADISNFMQASHNMLYYMPTDLCVMTYRKNAKTYAPYRQGGVTVSGGTYLKERKERAIAVPLQSVSLRLPFMDNFKLSILGSLTAVRLSR